MDRAVLLGRRARLAAGDRLRARALRPGAGIISAVAVLPFTNLGSNPEDSYLSDGLTEDLITRLGTLEGFGWPRARRRT